MMKKCISIFLVSILFITAVKAAGGFIDVGLGHAYKDAIYYAYENGIVKGYSDMTYRPDELITRGQFTKIIVGSTIEEGKILMLCSIMSDPGLGYVFTAPPPEYYETKDFSDVNRTDTFGDYICYAKANNIISGYSDGAFRPEANISLGQASKIIVNSYNLSSSKITNLREAVRILADNKYIPLGKLSINKYLTRAEIAEMIWRVRSKTPSANSWGAQFIYEKQIPVRFEDFDINTNKLTVKLNIDQVKYYDVSGENEIISIVIDKNQPFYVQRFTELRDFFLNAKTVLYLNYYEDGVVYVDEPGIKTNYEILHNL